ncbi:MAG: hypothetical protein MUC99_09420 [Anaerolineae bacterium]|nr:hypothetical protein [Anaerolineae bacterium]
MKRWIVLVLALVSLTSAALAADDTTEDPRENACYAGGTLEGKCDWPTDAEDEWAWNCGWYLAAYENGRASADSLPETCKILIDQAPSCYFSTTLSEFDFRLVGALDTLLNAEAYFSTDGTCSGGVAAYGTLVVSDDGGLEATAKCAAISAVYVASANISYYDNAPANWYLCQFTD